MLFRRSPTFTAAKRDPNLDRKERGTVGTFSLRRPSSRDNKYQTAARRSSFANSPNESAISDAGNLFSLNTPFTENGRHINFDGKEMLTDAMLNFIFR